MKRKIAALAILGVSLIGASACGVANAANDDSAEQNAEYVLDAQAGPSAAALKAKTKGCANQVSHGLYAENDGGHGTIPVCGAGGAVYFTADLDVDCDGQSSKQCNKSTDPDYQSQTAWTQSNGKYLNAATLPYIVVPGISSKWNYRNSHITGGTIAAVVYGDKVAYAVVGDVGPAGAVGEGSYALAKQLGMDPSPRHGGVEGRKVTYILFPDTKASKIEDHKQAVDKGSARATKFAGAAAGEGEVTINEE